MRCASKFAIVPALLCAAAALQARAATYYVIVAGLGGEPDYVQRFTADANELNSIYTAEGPAAHVITLTGANSTAANLTQALESVARAAKPDDDFVLILIGHGSFDGVDYKFNLVGPDMTAEAIAALCDRIPSHRQLIVDTTSASGGAVQAFERQGRGVITATKSGAEKNTTVFARYWVEAFQDPSADINHSGSISALGAFIYAARKTADFYDQQKLLATEHAVFNDRGAGEAVRVPGDGDGDLLASFTLLRSETNPRVANDPTKRALLAQKDELEQKIDMLKYRKAAMDPGDYRTQLMNALVSLAKVQEALDK